MNPPPLPGEQPPSAGTNVAWQDLAGGHPPAPRLVWPTVIGVISIVLAAYGMVTGLIGLFAAGALQKGGGLGQLGWIGPAMEKMNQFSQVQAIGLSILGVLLLGSGILLILRRPVARAMFLTWAVLRLGFAFSMAPLQLAYMESMMEQLMNGPASIHAAARPSGAGSAATPTVPPAPTPAATVTPAPASTVAPPASAAPSAPSIPPPAAMASISHITAMVFIGFSTVMVCLFPGFLLVWFNLRPVRDYIGLWPLKR